MSIEYYIIDPEGNITALVTTPVQKSLYKETAKRIMAEEPGVEQVGFTDREGGDIKLNMAGDEFCGNATMSAAALDYYLGGDSGKVAKSVHIKPDDLTVEVTVSGEKGVFDCKGLMPLPRAINDYTFTAGGKIYTFPLVSLDGIVHIIADNSLQKSDAESVIKTLAGELRVPALGFMIFNKDNNTLVPLVYVAAVNTVFFEKSCASGTCALAAAQGAPGKTEIIQPGGVITAELKTNGVLIGSRLKIIKHCFKE